MMTRLVSSRLPSCVFSRPTTTTTTTTTCMTWACEVAAMRLLKKCKKETLIMRCNDFGIPTSGNKEKLAEEAAEQLHYETDDDSDDDQ